ncbi:hypothetical protein HPS57_11730 [Prevotella sp. PINT]|uniref:hypothetical protein n=1 Tax=Palleniella intestinalis TaxID=2736291 RepID=UPI001556B7FB|nr:hypothetical protein [Palleniella intestinalis]NPD82635.1 hypothetical protein [Palleniella intestinalis]
MNTVAMGATHGISKLSVRDRFIGRIKHHHLHIIRPIFGRCVMPAWQSLSSILQQDFAVKCGGATILMVTPCFSSGDNKNALSIVWWNHTPLCYQSMLSVLGIKDCGSATSSGIYYSE